MLNSKEVEDASIEGAERMYVYATDWFVGFCLPQAVKDAYAKLDLFRTSTDAGWRHSRGLVQESANARKLLEAALRDFIPTTPQIFMGQLDELTLEEDLEPLRAQIRKAVEAIALDIAYSANARDLALVCAAFRHRQVVSEIAHLRKTQESRVRVLV